MKSHFSILGSNRKDIHYSQAMEATGNYTLVKKPHEKATKSQSLILFYELESIIKISRKSVIKTIEKNDFRRSARFPSSAVLAEHQLLPTALTHSERDSHLYEHLTSHKCVQ